MTMPERIWAWHWLTDTYLGQWQSKPTEIHVEYIRADLVDHLSDPRVKALVELLREANEDLKAHINSDWPPAMRDTFPDMQRVWERDMELCHRIDAALRAIEEGGA